VARKKTRGRSELFTFLVIGIALVGVLIVISMH